MPRISELPALTGSTSDGAVFPGTIDDVARGITPYQITRTLSPSASSAEIVAAFQAGGIVRLLRGTYDVSGFAGSVIPLNSPLVIIGEGWPRTSLTGGGTANVVTTSKFLIKNRFAITGVQHENTRAMWGLSALDTTVDNIEISNCSFVSAGAILLSDPPASPGTPNEAAALGTVRVNYNRVRSSHSGVWMRLGRGADEFSVPISYFEAIGNDMEGLNRAGICCLYDSPPTDGDWAVKGLARARGNRIADQNPSSGSDTGFGINLSACETAHIVDNHLQDIVKGTRVNVEAIYCKSKYNVIAINTVRDGDQDQGAIAVKNDDDGQVGSALVIGNQIFSENMPQTGASTAIWVQGQRATIVDNKMYGTWTAGGVIRFTTGSDIEHITIADNEIIIEDPHAVTVGPGSGIFVREWVTNCIVRDNRIYVNGTVQSNFKGIAVQSRTEAGEDITAPLIEGNALIWGPSASGGGTQRAINITRPDADGEIVDPTILRNHISGFAEGIRFEGAGGAVTGTAMVMYNTARGVTTEVNNVSASTVDERYNSWDGGSP